MPRDGPRAADGWPSASGGAASMPHGGMPRDGLRAAGGLLPASGGAASMPRGGLLPASGVRTARELGVPGRSLHLQQRNVTSALGDS